ncbi:MAG TPA: tripartite tricarboxylate transporter substrate binding protein [Burkholderiales bacterium]|jgi:tripartite-type tricarboxylate transporter receptor subunit TctC
MPLPNAGRRRAARFSLFAAALFALGAPAAQAQTKLSHPIRLIVPYVPGGGTDILSRLLGPSLAEEFGVSVVIENRPGGGSTIGTQLVARAPADGYTLGMIDAAFITNPSLMKSLPYDTMKDFTPMVLVATSPLVMVVPTNSPAKSVAEFVTYAKAKAGKISFGSAGVGTGVHLAAEQFRAAAKLDMTHIPYKGTGQAVTELVGGQTDMMFTTQSAAHPMTTAGRMRALAITSPKRSAVMPEVPTMTEAGYPMVDAVTINGIVGPLGMPADITQRVNAAMNRALKNREILQKMNDQGFAPAGGSPEDFAKWIRVEVPKWSKIIREAGITAE